MGVNTAARIALGESCDEKWGTLGRLQRGGRTEVNSRFGIGLRRKGEEYMSEGCMSSFWTPEGYIELVVARAQVQFLTNRKVHQITGN